MYFGPLGIYGFLNPALLCAKDFHGNSDGKVSACNAGDSGSIPGLGRSPGGGSGKSLQQFCLEILVDRGAWQARVHGVTKCWIQLSDFHFHSHNLGFLVKGKFSYDLRITILDTLYSNEISQ